MKLVSRFEAATLVAFTRMDASSSWSPTKASSRSRRRTLPRPFETWASWSFSSVAAAVRINIRWPTPPWASPSRSSTVAAVP